MRTSFLVPLLVIASLTPHTPAQHPMGFTVGWDQTPSGTTIAHNPQTYSFLEGDFLTRIDHDDYRSWGLDPTVDPSYGTLCLAGIEFVIEDPDMGTAETPAYVTGWSEDPNNPNFPDVSGFNPITGGSNFMFAGPVPPNSSPATTFTFTFATPLPCVGSGEDVFLGLHMGPEAGGEGLWMHGVTDENYPAFDPIVFDNPGPAATTIPQGSYVCVVPTQGLDPSGEPAVYVGSLAQNRFEVFLSHAAGGVATTMTNQSSYQVSNLASVIGTPNYLSGLHPDASSTPVNEGRNEAPPTGWTGDRIGFVYTDSRLQSNDPVAVYFAFSPASQPLRLDAFSGTGMAPTGQILINQAFFALAGSGLAQAVADSNFTYSRFALTLDFPPSTRDWLVTHHPTLHWQGFGLDSSGNVHATGMVRQHF